MTILAKEPVIVNIELNKDISWVFLITSIVSKRYQMKTKILIKSFIIKIEVNSAINKPTGRNTKTSELNDKPVNKAK